MTALHSEREKTRALSDVIGLLGAEFSTNIESAEVDQLQEVQQRHGVDAGEAHAQKVDSLKVAFENATIPQKVDLWKSSKNALAEDAKRKSVATFNDVQSVENLDKDAKYTGDVWRGPDSTTDFNDTAQVRSEDQEASTEYNVDENISNASGNSETDTVVGAETDPKEYGDSHVETQQKADEAVEEAKKAQEAATTSAEKAQDTADAATDDVEQESNNPQRDENRGYPGTHKGGGTTEGSKIEDRPVKMDDPDEFDSQAEKLKVAQLSNIESKFDNLNGEGKRKKGRMLLKSCSTILMRILSSSW